MNMVLTHGKCERVALMAAVAGAWVAPPALAQQSAEDLAKALANPVAAMISVPLQLNYDRHVGPAEDGDRWTLNVQPVVPFDLNENWNLISRTILPITHQSDIFPGAGSQNGLGDVVQSVFFSPKKPTASGWIWGAGPVFLLPTGTDSLLSAKKWGIGPTGVALRQQGPWTYGMLANHIWSFAGDDDRRDVSATFVQPFMTYTTPDAWSYTLQSETTYDWKGNDWTIPINAFVAKVTKFGDQLVSIGAGVGYYVDSPDSAAKGFRYRVAVTFLFPR
jgi:hypothetical protein